jgi:hypothetical protein
MGKVGVSDNALVVTFVGPNEEPEFKFSGTWSIQKLGRVRRLLFRAYKHYIREVRLQNNKEVLK